MELEEKQVQNTANIAGTGVPDRHPRDARTNRVLWPEVGAEGARKKEHFFPLKKKCVFSSTGTVQKLGLMLFIPWLEKRQLSSLGATRSL